MQHRDKAVFKSSKDIKNSFVKIGEILKSENIFEFSKIALLINQILIELLCTFRCDNTDISKNSPNQNVVKYFLQQLPNYCVQCWTLENMAQDCGLKPTRFAYYCKILTNSTPLEILNNLRLEKARGMLEDKYLQASLTEIALSCGFSTSQYFATKFKEKFGVSPRKYRETSAF